jgi:hypothetical protein
MLKKTIGILMFTLFFQSCKTAPERINKEQINNPTLHAELKPLEREIVEINYRIKKQMEREKEFIQAEEETNKRYKDADKIEKETLKIEVQRAKLKARIETSRRESLQLRLQERIARYELKKAAMISSESETPIELVPYEKFHKDTESKWKSKEESIKEMEGELKSLESNNNNNGV